jgi:phosphocarrier protein FPr
MTDKIRFCGAPLVEGAIAAAVQVGLTRDLDAICREANAALAPKHEQLGEQSDEASSPSPVLDEVAESITLTLTNLHGLHARPAAKFVQTAARFMANVTVTDLTNGKGPVSARSLNAIATLGAVEDHRIRISASGEESKLVLSALKVLIEDNFGETPAASTTKEQPVEVQKMMRARCRRSFPMDLHSRSLQIPGTAPTYSTHPAENAGEWTRLQARWKTPAGDYQSGGG